MNALAPAAPDVREALDFLGELPHHTVNLIAISPAGGPPVGITRPQGHPDLAAFVEQHVGASNLYFSANEPRPDAPDAKLRKEHIARVTTLFADIDPTPGADLAAERSRLRALADDLNGELWAPTYTIDSGGGLQALWQLREPIEVTPENIAAVEAQGRGIAANLGGDQVQNIDRILRLPGTINFPNAKKRAAGRTPSPARIIGRAAWPVTLPALAMFAAPLDAPPSTAGATAYNGPLDMGEVMEASDFDELPAGLRDRFAAACAASPRLAALWKGEPHGLRDVSRSGFDFAVAGALKGAGFTATETGQILWTYEHGRGVELDERDVRRAYGRAPEPHDLPSATDEFDRVALGDEHLTKPPTPEETRRLTWVRAGDLAVNRPAPYLIKGLLDQGAMSVLYGESNTGKSFLALDMAHAIATGRDWFGKRVRAGLAFYVAAEAGRSIGARLLALQQHCGDLDDAPFAVLPCPIDLLRPDADAGLLVAAINEAAVSFGRRPAFVVIDTLSRALAGGNENAADDMGAFVMNADRVRDKTGAHMMIVHHSGKDRAKGARGHSLLRAATDTEIEVADGVARVTKQRDMESGARLPFTLSRVLTGTDEEGEPVTSCVVAQEAAPAADDFGVIDTQFQREAQDEAICAAILKVLDGRSQVPLAGVLDDLRQEIADARGWPGCAESTARQEITRLLDGGRRVENDQGAVLLYLRRRDANNPRSALLIERGAVEC